MKRNEGIKNIIANNNIGKEEIADVLGYSLEYMDRVLAGKACPVGIEAKIDNAVKRIIARRNGEYNRFFISYGIEELPQAGYYFDKYNEVTGEGIGFFGTCEADAQYIVEREIHNDVLCQRTCGFGEGCFFTEWQPLY